MFNLFARRPAAAAGSLARIVTEAAVDIAAPASEVIDRLDPASPRNAMRLEGYAMTRGPAGSVEVTHPDLGELVIRLERISISPPDRISFSSVFESAAPFGGVSRMDSLYTLVSGAPDACTVHLTETATLRPGLSNSARRREEKMQAKAVTKHLARLKVHFEHGAEAAMAL